MMRGRKPMMLYDLYNGDKMQGKYSAAELILRMGAHSLSRETTNWKKVERD